MKNINNYRTVTLSTEIDCLESEYAYILNLDFEPKSNELNKIREELKKCELILKRNDPPQDNFSYFESEELSSSIKFNTIVFGDLDLKNITFFIKFLNPQKTETISNSPIKFLRLDISTFSNDEKETENLVSFLVSTSDLNEDYNKRTGLKDYQFKSVDYKIKKESYQKYATEIDQLLGNRDQVMLMGECGISTNKDSWRFWIKDEEDIFGFNELSICIYESDLCCLKFDTTSLQFELSSLTKEGYFGKFSYKSGIITVPKNSSFYRLCGPNIIYISDDYYYIYSIFNLSRFSTSGYKIERETSGIPNLLISDPWEITGYSKFISSYDLFEKLSSLTSLSFEDNRDTFLEYSSGWAKLKYGNSLEDYYMGERGYVIDNTKKIKWITKNLMLYSEGSNVAIIPQLYYYLKISVEKDNEGNSQIILKNDKNVNEKETIGLFNINTGYQELPPETRIILDGLRRKPFKITFPNPDNVILYRGLIFYKSNNKLILY